MSTKSLRMEEPKTECPECGNIWQEHTINEHDGCMALMNLGLAVALARDAELQGKAAAPTVVLCPVCSKTSPEHTEAAVRSCATKWRKRDRGSTGLELQHSFLEAQFENEETDPVKRVQSRAKALQILCSCGKAYGDHTPNELMACAQRNRGKR